MNLNFEIVEILCNWILVRYKGVTIKRWDVSNQNNVGGSVFLNGFLVFNFRVSDFTGLVHVNGCGYGSIGYKLTIEFSDPDFLSKLENYCDDSFSAAKLNITFTVKSIYRWLFAISVVCIMIVTLLLLFLIK